MLLFLDTESTGLPKSKNLQITDSDNRPRLVQISWILFDEKNNKNIAIENYLIQPKNFSIPREAIKIHGINTAVANKEGFPLEAVLASFSLAMNKATLLIAHNIEFDINLVASEMYRFNMNDDIQLLNSINKICTMKSSTDYAKIPSANGYKWPTLDELYYVLFDKTINLAHDSSIDVQVCATCFFEMIQKGVI